VLHGRKEADPHRIAPPDEVPEATGQQDGREVLIRQAKALLENLYPRPDRPLGQLNLANVPLGESNRLVQAAFALANQDELQSLLSWNHSAPEGLWQVGRQVLRRQEPSRGLENPRAEQLGHGVNERAATDSPGGDVSHDAHRHVLAQAHLFDCSRGGSHAVANPRPLEGRPGGGRAGHEAAIERHDHLAVRPDVHGQGRFSAVAQPRGKDHPHGVAADEARDVWEDVDAPALVDPQAEFGGREREALADHRSERNAGNLFRVEAEQQVAHGGVSHDGGLVDLAAWDSRALLEFAQDVVQAANDERLEFAQGALGRVADPGYHIVAERHLRICPRSGRQFLSRAEVQERADHGRRPDVECHSVEPRGGIARLESDDVAVVGDRGEGSVARLHQPGQFAHCAEFQAQRAVMVEGRSHSVGVCLGIIEVGSVGADGPLPDRWGQFPRLPLAGRQDPLLGEARGLRDRDGGLGQKAGLAGQAMALGEFLGREEAALDLGRLRAAVATDHATLPTSAASAAGRLDDDPGPRRRLEDHAARQHVGRLALRLEDHADALGQCRLPSMG